MNPMNMATYSFEEWMSILKAACASNGAKVKGHMLPSPDDTEDEFRNRLYDAYADGQSAWSVAEELMDE